MQHEEEIRLSDKEENVIKRLAAKYGLHPDTVIQILWQMHCHSVSPPRQRIDIRSADA